MAFIVTDEKWENDYALIFSLGLSAAVTALMIGSAHHGCQLLLTGGRGRGRGVKQAGEVV